MEAGVEEEGEDEEEDGGGLVNQWRINLYHIEKNKSDLFVLNFICTLTLRQFLQIIVIK